MTTLLSFGEVLVDLLPVDDQPSMHQPIAGGAPANVAVGYTKLGGRSYFAGGISDDEYGHMLTRELAGHGVDVSHLALVPNAATATVLVNLDANGERSFSFNRQDTADMLYSAAHFDSLNWSVVDIFHLCSNTFTEAAIFNSSMHGVKTAYAQKKLISFDVNLRLSLWADVNLLAGRVEQCLPYTHVLKMSHEEAVFLAGARGVDVEEYLQHCLHQGVTLILITNGPEPVRCFSQAFSFDVAVPCIQPVDTTAAGDSFVAGLLWQLGESFEHASAGDYDNVTEVLSSRAVVEHAVKFAIKCGAMTCSVKGAFPALPSLVALIKSEK
ncbi:carbohydrate kinase family protein [Shewanella ulleungensis]|uniref:carbohydrate kinase family protein n=1 Tax=Shewanella ulleungensis TaxID=2282699 RepID=UPI003D7B79B2